MSLFVRGFDGSNLLFSFRHPLGQKGVVLGLLLLLSLEMAFLERKQMTSTLETLRRNQSLNLGTAGHELAKESSQVQDGYIRLGVRPGILLLRALNLSSHNILPDVILL